MTDFGRSGWARSVLPDTRQRVPWPEGGFHLKTMDSHGGWIASPIDLVRFTTALGDRPPHLLERHSVVQMLSRPDLPTWQDTPSYYGMGWGATPWRGDVIWWHNGGMPGSVSILARTYDGTVWAALFNSRPENSRLFREEVQRLLWDQVGAGRNWPVLTPQVWPGPALTDASSNLFFSPLSPGCDVVPPVPFWESGSVVFDSSVRPGRVGLGAASSWFIGRLDFVLEGWRVDSTLSSASRSSEEEGIPSCITRSPSLQAATVTTNRTNSASKLTLLRRIGRSLK